MKLARLSALSIVGCLIGLMALLGAALTGLDRMQQTHQEVTTLFELRGRLDDFSAASDALLLHGADPELWEAFRSEADAIQRRLDDLGADHPDVRRAGRQIDAIVAALERAGVAEASDTPGDAGTAPELGGPLGLPIRGRLIMGQVAGYGMTLDTVVDRLVRQRDKALARQSTWVAGGFAGAALLFGAICVLTFLLLHRRVVGPIRSLQETIASLTAGMSEARAPVRGKDELAELSSAFNALADQRHEALAALQHNERMLAESQRIARVGSWRLHLNDMTLEWSEQTYHILGLDPATFTPTPEAFLAYVHEDDLPALLQQRDRVLDGEQYHDIEFRIVRDDGMVLHVHERAEIEYGRTGEPRYLSGTIQDITEQYRQSEHLNQYRRLIEASSDRFCIIDSNHRYTLCNSNYAGVMGHTPAQIEGKHVAEVLGDSFYESEVRAPIDHCLAGGTQSFEAVRNYPYLGKRQVLIRYYPIPSADGEIRHVGMVMTELTELKQARAQLSEQRKLLTIAGRVARVGGWSMELPSERITWSVIAADLLGVSPDYSPTLDEAIEPIAPRERERLRSRLAACIDNGTELDEELEFVTAHGDARWLRIVGEPAYDDQGRMVRMQGALQDISADKEAERELKRLHDRLRTTLESITDAFFTLDTDWHFTYVNAEAERLLQRPKEELIGRHVWTEFPQAVGTPIEREYRRALAEGTTAALEEYYEPLDTWFDIRAYPSEEGLAVFFRDVSERHAMLERLETQERELRASRDELAEALDTRQTLINALPAHIALVDPFGEILDVNDRWRHFGWTNDSRDPRFGVGSNYLTVCRRATGDCAAEAEQAHDGLLAVLQGEQETFSLEYPCHAPDKNQWFRMMANGLNTGSGGTGAGSAVVMHIDITERKLAEQELDRLAYEDALTSTPSRNGLVRALGERLAATGWQPDAMVVMLDVRQLRDINDAHGYAAGDELLRLIARRLESCTGEGALVSRIGGDEFGVYLPQREDQSAEQQRDTLAAAFAQPFPLGQLSVEIVASFGYTFLGSEERGLEDLVREAELALYQARQAGRADAWIAYTNELHEQARERIQITRELRQALTNDEFQLHFQPKVDLRSGQPIGSEALLRWMHPEHGLLSPARFMDTAERSQLIGPIGEWVIHEACRCLAQWRAEGLDILRVAVNVSLVQFTVGDLTELVRDALSRHDVAPDGLTLEITESVFERDPEMLLRQLNTLHEMGVRLALDDFGTGYSSLAYLQKYPFDEIKIDRSFVQGMLDDIHSRNIVTTVLAISQGLGAEVVAEGVETTHVRDVLLNMGCHYGQGFYYSVPLAEEDFHWLLEKRSALPLGGKRSHG